MTWLALSLGGLDWISIVLWLMAWFITIGLHEGGHGWVAWWLGDDTAYHQGQRSLNPVRHINVNDQRSLMGTIILPLITVLAFRWPIGFAWVNVNPAKFRHPTRDMALTALAGPGGNLVGAILGILMMIVAVGIATSTNSNLALHPFEYVTAPDGSAPLHILGHFGLRMLVLNVILGAINLLPIPGVDGGAVLYHFLNHRGREIFEQIRPYGLFVFIAVAWFLLREQVGQLFMFAGGTVPRWIFSMFGS